MARLDDDQLEALRSDALTPAQIAVKAVSVGETKASLSAGKAFLLACLAGAFISFGAALMLVVKADTTLSFAVSQLLSGLVFSVGLFMVVTAGAELFTGNSLMVMGLLEKKYSPAQLMRAWAIVYAGNLLGALMLAWLLDSAQFGALGGGAVADAALAVATAKAKLAPTTVIFRGILCNMLVCLAVWMSFAARTVIDKLASCVMPVMAFVACGFEHCVANMFFLPFAMYGAGGASLAPTAVAANIAFATLGNLIGGVVFIGCIYWLVYLCQARG